MPTIMPTKPTTSTKSTKPTVTAKEMTTKKNTTTEKKISQSSNKNTSNNADFLTKNGFQSLYLEYYACLQDFDANEISSLYCQGLKHNLVSANFNTEVLRYIKKEVMEFADAIRNRALAYKQTLQQYATLEASDIQNSLALILNQEIQEGNEEGNQEKSSETEKASTAQQLINLKKKAQNHLQTHPKDMLTEFNLAWMEKIGMKWT